ncbi:hypothetical protein C2G38_2220728 [Gigaspora rosea]|uniref:Uncharacterized protein n=1 Tax=Gigaspora rosea TaxID=44941 RepID=A0A397U438_9GLOM|nr:hypothetical protein C2G38_2220728 [Gigaspora rosea]
MSGIYNLENKVYVITTNNSANIIKEIILLNDDHLLEVNWQLQAQRLRESQINLANLPQDNGTISPLEVLIDCKTRWNSSYLAWKRILELYLAILKLLSFATSREQNSIKYQIQAELFVLEPNHHKSDNEKTQDTIEKDCDSLSAEL